MKNLEDMSSNPEPSGSTNDFFEAMEREVNGAIMEEQDTNMETLPEVDGPLEATHQLPNEGPKDNSIDWEKRYKDSSREATKIRDELNRLKPFVPVLEAMEKDSGLVDTVRNYLENGGTPAKNVKEQLGLDEDFIFDSDEALNNPDSDSAKVFNAHVDKLVQQRVNNTLQNEKAVNQKAQMKNRMRQEAEAFMQKHNMSKEDFAAMIEASKTRQMGLDDIYYLLNKDKASANVADATKADMMNQMKTVRDIQPSAGGINSPRSEVSPDDQIFDMINGDGGLDELFS